MGRRVVVVGSGMGGMVAALAAARGGADVMLVEKGDRLGGALAYSGGQVWVGGNHVAATDGIDDSVDDAATYVCDISSDAPELLDDELAAAWLEAAPQAARWLEELGAVRWEVIPGYPDYYYPDAAGSRSAGRYLTGAPFSGEQLGAWRDRLNPAPHFPSGITYGEMFSWGGISSKTTWDRELLQRRRAEDVLTFGQGIAAGLLARVVEAGVDVRTGVRVERLRTLDGQVVGVDAVADGEPVTLDGAVILATGGTDWREGHLVGFTPLPEAETGSVAPGTIEGDGVALATEVGAATQVRPPHLAPHLPGYRLLDPAWEGDTGYRSCMEHCLPHTFVVDGTGRRFCADDFHRSLVAAAFDADGSPSAHVPMFMIWDDQHHQRYGLGTVMPGRPYPDGLVATADTLPELGALLGVDGDALAATAETFNEGARRGEDPAFGRGSNLSVQLFRGDRNHEPNANLGAVEEPPFHGMHLRLLGTGIAASGLDADPVGRVQDTNGDVIKGLYAVGVCAAPGAVGGGYNSGYSLSRAMTFGWLAGDHVAEGQGAA